MHKDEKTWKSEANAFVMESAATAAAFIDILTHTA